jgi:hypothetical protein
LDQPIAGNLISREACQIAKLGFAVRLRCQRWPPNQRKNLPASLIGHLTNAVASHYPFV